jgi:signal peptidase I
MTTSVHSQRRSTAGAVLGWLRLIAATLGEIYLILLLALVVIAFLPTAFGWQATVVQTNSMQPRIAPGDVALTAPWTTKDPVPLGGVVSYLSPAEAEPDGAEKIRLHRIVADNGDGTYTTAGDANANVDSVPLAPEQIIGQGRLLVEHIGLPSVWAKTGQYGALMFWAGLTVAALVVVFVAKRDEDDGVTEHPDLASSGASDELDCRPVATPTRRAALGALGTVAVLTLALRSVPESHAAFSARTSSGGSTWVYEGVPAPDLGRAAAYGGLASVRVSSTGGGGNSHIRGLAGTDADALRDARALYSDWSSRLPTGSLDLSTQPTVAPGTHSVVGDLPAGGTLRIDAGGDPEAIIVLHAASLTVGQGARMVLSGGARAANVFWLVAGGISMGRSTATAGSFLSASGDVTLDKDAVVDGRVIALNGAISLFHATIRVPA